MYIYMSALNFQVWKTKLFLLPVSTYSNAFSEQEIASGKRLNLGWFPVQFSSIQSLSHVRLSATPWTPVHQASLSVTNSQSLLKYKSVMPSNHLIICCPLFPPPSIFPSIRVFSTESVFNIRWAKYWSFSLSTGPSNKYSGLISFRMY